MAAFLLPMSAPSPAPAQNHTEKILAGTKACAVHDWQAEETLGRTRETYERAVECIRDLYVEILAQDVLSWRKSRSQPEELRRELAGRFDAARAAFESARDVCGLKAELGIGSGCESPHPAAFEFIVLLKQMLLYEHSWPQGADPRVEQALGIPLPAWYVRSRNQQDPPR